MERRPCGLGLGPGPGLSLQDRHPGIYSTVYQEVNEPMQQPSIPTNQGRNEMEQQSSYRWGIASWESSLFI